MAAERKTGVYFLIDSGRVVYIGQTTNFKARLPHHKRDKKFDSHRLIECEPSKRHDYEKRWLRIFKPKYNINLAEPTVVIRVPISILDEVIRINRQP